MLVIYYGTLDEVKKLDYKVFFAVFIWKKKSRCITFVDNEMYLKPPKFFSSFCEENLYFMILELKLN